MPAKKIVPILFIGILTGCQSSGSSHSPATTPAERPTADSSPTASSKQDSEPANEGKPPSQAVESDNERPEGANVNQEQNAPAASKDVAKKDAPSDVMTARLYVKGMSCPLCANNIDQQLRRIPGVQKVSVDLGTGLVLARLSPTNPPSRDQLAGAIAQSGFTLDRIEMPETEGGQP